MTEQPPSTEALAVADKVYTWGLNRGAVEIDALCAQRVSAETRACALAAGYPDHSERGHEARYKDGRLDAMSAVLARAPAERPAPPQQKGGGYVIEVEFDDGKEAQRAYDAIERLLGEMGQLGTLGMRPLPSGLASTGETKEQTHRRYYDAFHAWFMQSGCDFWNECDAPESLATIAVELHDNIKSAPLVASTGEQPDKEEDFEARAIIQDCWGALNFILAFYEPGQRYLDTNAWKQAEASGRRAHAKARAWLDAALAVITEKLT